MKLIVNTDINWGIGKNNDLLFSNKEDMKFFRRTTTGGTVVMGRKTLESFPGGKPLKNRVNVVMTNNPDYQNDEVVVCRNRTQLAKAIENADGEVFLIGGASMYNEFMDCCTHAYVTRTFADGDADCFINSLDIREGWHISDEGEMQTAEDSTNFKFVTYKNNSVKSI